MGGTAKYYPKTKLGWIFLLGVIVFHFILGMVPWPWMKSHEPLIGGWFPLPYFYGFVLYVIELVYIVIVGYFWLKR